MPNTGCSTPATYHKWAAHIWASWYPGLGDRYKSFAALVDAERESFEELSGRAGRPVHPAGADTLVAHGRELAMRGDVVAAADAFARAAVKGSGAGAYLAVILNGFLEPAFVHHEIRNNVPAAGGDDPMSVTALVTAGDPHRSVFAGVDVCREARLGLPATAHRPMFDDDVWDFTMVEGLPTQMARTSRRFDFTAILDTGGGWSRRN